MNKLAIYRYTDRLELKPINEDLADGLWELFQDEGVAYWYGGKWSKKKAQIEATKMGDVWGKPNGVHKWLAFDKTSHELIGRGGLSVVDFEGNKEVEIGWAIRQKYWGKGYATEIGKAGLDLAFNELGVDHVIAYTEPHNTNSQAVMERLGFHYVKKAIYNDELFVLYILTKDEYLEGFAQV